MDFIPSKAVLEGITSIRQDDRQQEALRSAFQGEIEALKEHLLYSAPEQDVFGLRQSIVFLEGFIEDLMDFDGRYATLANQPEEETNSAQSSLK